MSSTLPEDSLTSHMRRSRRLRLRGHSTSASGRHNVADIDLGDDTLPDPCESFNISGFDDPIVRKRATVAGYEPIFLENLGRHLRPSCAPFEAYYAELEARVAMLLLFAAALDLPDTWFDDKIADHTSLLLANWYPLVTADVHAGQLRRYTPITEPSRSSQSNRFPACRSRSTGSGTTCRS